MGRPGPVGSFACTALIVALAAPCGPAARADVDAAPTLEALDAAIDGGVAYLVEEREVSGSWGGGQHEAGQTALVALVLLESGVRTHQETDAAETLARALAWIERHGPGRRSRTASRDVRFGTYTVALTLLVYRLRAAPGDAQRVQRLADALVALQAANGQWSYELRRGRPPDAGDNSNTQFGVLALAAAAGEGASVPPEAFARARAWWLSCAQRDGGFGYASGGSTRSATTGSMTAAGVACLAVLDAALAGDVAPDAGPTIERAAARLGEVFSPSRNHGPARGRVGQRQRNAGAGWEHYYLWSVERAMVLLGRERLGPHDWYGAGARHLLETQADDGSWRGSHPLWATSFALLFLSRAADPPRAFTPRRDPVVTGRPGPGAQGEGAGEPADAHGTVADWLAEGLAPDVLAARCRRRGPETLRALALALDHPEAIVRRRAFEGLVQLLPETRIGRADRHPLPRARLGVWLRRHGDSLVLEDGRFVLRREGP